MVVDVEDSENELFKLWEDTEADPLGEGVILLVIGVLVVVGV